MMPRRHVIVFQLLLQLLALAAPCADGLKAADYVDTTQINRLLLERSQRQGGRLQQSTNFSTATDNSTVFKKEFCDIYGSSDIESGYSCFCDFDTRSAICTFNETCEDNNVDEIDKNIIVCNQLSVNTSAGTEIYNLTPTAEVLTVCRNFHPNGNNPNFESKTNNIYPYQVCMMVDDTRYDSNTSNCTIKIKSTSTSTEIETCSSCEICHNDKHKYIDYVRADCTNIRTEAYYSTAGRCSYFGFSEEFLTNIERCITQGVNSDKCLSDGRGKKVLSDDLIHFVDDDNLDYGYTNTNSNDQFHFDYDSNDKPEADRNSSYLGGIIFATFGACAFVVLMIVIVDKRRNHAIPNNNPYYSVSLLEKYHEPNNDDIYPIASSTIPTTGNNSKGSEWYEMEMTTLIKS